MASGPILTALPSKVELAVETKPSAAPDAAHAGGAAAHQSELQALEQDCRAWLRLIAQGDDAALTQLYDHTSSRVYGLALRITRSRCAAEDVLIEVYWQVWRQAASYAAERGSALGWLMLLCRSRALDFLRNQDKAELHAKTEDYADGSQQTHATPEELLLAVERSSAVHAALRELSALQRQLLTLAFFRGYTHQEIAACMSLPLGSVKTHMRRALQTLRGKLRPKVDADEN